MAKAQFYCRKLKNETNLDCALASCEVGLPRCGRFFFQSWLSLLLPERFFSAMAVQGSASTEKVAAAAAVTLMHAVALAFRPKAARSPFGAGSPLQLGGTALWTASVQAATAIVMVMMLVVLLAVG